MVFDSISSNIDKVLLINPSANVFIFGDFKVHDKDWLTSSAVTDRSGEPCCKSQTTLLRLTKYHVVIIRKKVHTFIFMTNPFIILKHISDFSSELHSLSSFHLYNIIHKNSYFCQGGYRDKLQ